ncbi:MAG: hypothetical protein J7K46_06590 [Bacteroidales bacterium]|nr:hypothetical protein [Bacteroidales bacterium]
MAERETERHNQQLIKQLFSARDEVVLSVIKEIRYSGNPALIPAVMKLYSQTDSPTITDAVVALIRDMKSQPSVAPLIPALQDISDQDKKQRMVAACWQSGLDFSAHIQVFLQIFLEGDYMTALEAFTVIENALPFLHDKTVLKEHIAFFKEQSYRINPASDKVSLYHEMMKLLEENLQMNGE